MPFVHLTARAFTTDLLRHENAGWLWKRLRGRFEPALAACIMPDHLHLVTHVESAERAYEQFVHTLAGFSRLHGRRVWQPLPRPSSIATREKLARDVRYVVLNPCRARLTDDPLRWLWSTHRDVMGAVLDPWIDDGRLARYLGRPVRGFRQTFHAYVSADPSVDPTGTASPEPAIATTLPIVPLGLVARAAAMAVREDVSAIRRRGRARQLFVALAWHQGFTESSRLARACGIGPRAIRKIVSRTPMDWISPAAMCLGDERLLDGDAATRPPARSRARERFEGGELGRSRNVGSLTYPIAAPGWRNR